MIGGIIGDIVGSRFEFNNYKGKDFALFDASCRPTDDTIMTLAIAKSLLEYGGDMVRLERLVVENMQEMGNMYPDAGYGGRFARWLRLTDPVPYGSFGNGGAMRVSPVAYVASSLDEVIDLSNVVTRVTHNHVEGLKGAEAEAVSVYLAIHGHSIAEIKEYIRSCYYDMDFTLDEIRKDYIFHVDAMGSVKEGIESFLESNSFEDAIRNAVSIGGDSDTLACMSASIAEPYFKIPRYIRDRAYEFLDDYQIDIIERFERVFGTNTI